MTITGDIQGLEPGGLVDLFEVDATILLVGILRFHGYTQVGTIWWKGLEYSPWPIQADGFDRTSDKPPTPVFSLANLDGSITALCLSYGDLVGSKFTRRRTLTKYLDAANFPGGVNPTADPTQQMPDEIWYVERKTNETAEQVSFELASAMDFNNIMLPRRQIIANQCPWAYRDSNCGYTGGPVAKVDDTPTSDPLLDDCGKRVNSCKFRFGAAGQLRHGGFPAAGLIRS